MNKSSWKLLFDREYRFKKGIGLLSTNVISLLIGLFGGFLINLLTGAVQSMWALPAFVGFSVLIVGLYQLISLKENFEEKKEIIRINLKGQVFIEEQFTNITLVKNPEAKFTAKFNSLLWTICLSFLSALTFLLIANTQIMSVNSGKVSDEQASSKIVVRTLTDLDNRIILQDSLIKNLTDSVKLLSTQHRLKRPKILNPVAKKKHSKGMSGI